VRNEMKEITKTAIDVKDVSFSFGKEKALSNISFSIRKGDFFGLVGPNGGGKTTLIKLILGLYVPSSGRICSASEKIGYVPQKAGIDASFPASVFETVSLGLLSEKKFPKRIDERDAQRVRTALKSVGMEKFPQKRIGELSGGQQQRVLIARALVSEPQMLILDEPATGIDRKAQTDFYEMLANLNKNGITILLISHDIGRITRHANRVASLNNHLEFYGTHAEFCAYDKKHSHRAELGHRLCLDRG